jgi:hypothetical protein
MKEEIKNKYQKILLERHIKKVLNIINDPNIKPQNKNKKLEKHFPGSISTTIEDDQYIIIDNNEKRKISYLFHNNYVKSYKSFSILDEPLINHLEFIKEKLNEQLNRIKIDILYNINIIQDITNNQEIYFTPFNSENQDKYDEVYLINIKPKFVAIFEYEYDRKICNSYIISLKKIMKKELKKGDIIYYKEETILNLFFWYEKNNIEYPIINEFNLAKNINKDNLLIIANNYNNLIKCNKIDEKEPEIKINNNFSLPINRIFSEITVNIKNKIIENNKQINLKNNKVIKYLEK